MIYTLAFHIVGVYGPGGYARRSRSEVLGFAKSLANVALDHLGDWVGESEWFTAAGQPAESPYELLESTDEDEVESVISQINDLLVAKSEGYFGVQEFNDLPELLEYHHVSTWCSPVLRAKIQALEAAQESLIADLADEWSRC